MKFLMKIIKFQNSIQYFFQDCLPDSSLVDLLRISNIKDCILPAREFFQKNYASRTVLITYMTTDETTPIYLIGLNGLNQLTF